MKVLNFGSLNVDQVYSVDHILRGGETLSSEKLELFPGGKGLNQSIALARAGVPVFHAGTWGEGRGRCCWNCAGENGVDTRFSPKGGRKKRPYGYPGRPRRTERNPSLRGKQSEADPGAHR